jgi:hypothetical protein
LKKEETSEQNKPRATANREERQWLEGTNRVEKDKEEKRERKREEQVLERRELVAPRLMILSIGRRGRARKKSSSVREQSFRPLPIDLLTGLLLDHILIVVLSSVASILVDNI